MDTPFYRIHRNYPSSSPQIPVHHRTTTVLPKKVVSIPVRYVGSERSRSESAIKIQKVFRGFLVRKSMKKILATKRQVDEIEKRILMKETVELMRRDQKEKLKINEMLMSLLLKLDSVRGVDSGVRDSRKAVIKKAIALQETVDSIAAAANGDDTDDSVVSAGEKGVDETGEGEEENGSVANAADELQNGAAESEAVVSVLADSIEAREEFNGALENVDKASEGEKKVECDDDVPTLMSDYCEPERVLEVVNETVELKEAENDETASQGEDGDLEKQVDKDGDCMGTSQTESQSDSSASLMEGDDEDEEHSGGVEIEKKGDEGEVKSNDESTRRRGKELLERMLEDNERMMGLMAELFERNEMQTRLLSSLSQRVEQLERAYICDQLRRRKKKRNAAGVLDCMESTPKKL
uniref:BAG domain-containing protein n=1 Tax=Populus davidiana TaxID=266767 RepID=A0A6M2F154_9ROSI